MRLALAPKVAVVEKDTAAAKEDEVVVEEDTAAAEEDKVVVEEDKVVAVASKHRQPYPLRHPERIPALQRHRTAAAGGRHRIFNPPHRPLIFSKAYSALFPVP